MNPFTTITQQKFLIKALRKEYPNSKDKKRDWERIQILENCVNEFESMLQYLYYTDTIEKLIYSCMYEFFLKAEAQSVKGVPMPQFNNKMMLILDYNKEQMKSEVISIMQDLELNKILTELDPFAFDKDEEFNTKFINMTTKTDYSNLLNDYVNNLKQKIKWGKK